MPNITKQILDSKIETLNAQLSTDSRPYEYSLDWAYGGVKLVKRDKVNLSEADVHYTRLTKRELNTVLEAIINVNYIERG